MRLGLQLNLQFYLFLWCFTNVFTSQVNVCYHICPQIQQAPFATSLWTPPGAPSRSPRVRSTHSCRIPPPSNGHLRSQIPKGVHITCKRIGFQFPVRASGMRWPFPVSCGLLRSLKSSAVISDVTYHQWSVVNSLLPRWICSLSSSYSDP